MFNGIAFIGGIHGVGKSTICQQICRELNIEYLSASKLLKWKEINGSDQNKKVTDIHSTQNRLILSLKNAVQKEKYYLLDGHYCLINSNNEISNVPLETFEQINPFSLNLILGNISEIKKRLEIRDNKSYDHAFLECFQDKELNYAKQLSKILGINLNIGTPNDYSELVTSLSAFVKSKK